MNKLRIKDEITFDIYELENIMKKYSITQQELAEMTGFTRQYVNALIKKPHQASDQAKLLLKYVLYDYFTSNNLSIEEKVIKVKTFA